MDTSVSPGSADFNFSFDTGEGAYGVAQWWGSIVLKITIGAMPTPPTTWQLELKAQTDDLKTADGTPVCTFDESGNIL